MFLLIPAIVLSLTHCTEETESVEKTTIQAVEQLQEQPKPITTVSLPCNKLPIKSRIEIDISEQKLFLYCTYKNSQHEEVKTYPISSSKFGIGSTANTNKTPLGLHRIEQKIGDNAPFGMIFKARKATGRIAKINGKGDHDYVTTRIMWLKGLEPGKNAGSGIDSYRRYIYIHGTAEENKIGKPASHGCIRMYNKDVIDLFEKVSEGTEVYIKE
jgi:lipoprotein-anchoring transpeptidase ErfK/SrfK